MCLGVIRLDGKGFADQFGRNVVFSNLMGNHAEQMERDRLIWISLRYPMIEALRLRETSGVVMAQGAVQGLLHG
jgi:hypothetical protein